MMSSYNLRSKKSPVITQSIKSKKRRLSPLTTENLGNDDIDNDDEEIEDIDLFYDIDDDNDSDDGNGLSEYDIFLDCLISSITSKLRDRYPKLNKKRLRRDISKAVATERIGFLVQHYLSNIDNIKSKPLTEAEIKTQMKTKKKLLRELSLLTPTYADIINANLNKEDRARALIMFYQRDKIDPLSFEYLDYVQKLSDLINSNRDSKDINAALCKLRNTNSNSRHCLKSIVNANISDEHKLKALNIYDSLCAIDVAHPNYTSIVSELDHILQHKIDPSQNDLEQELRQKCDSTHNNHKSRILALNAPIEIKQRLFEMYDYMSSLSKSSDKYHDIYNKLSVALRLPYNNLRPINHDVREIQRRLDQGIYGMQHVKEQILRAVINKQQNPNSSVIIALEGPPGVGKTRVAQTIARALDLPFNTISFGGSIDSTILKGSTNVWSGSAPSSILDILAKSKCANPVVLFDEVDKLGSTPKGTELQNALLHILDPTQNTEFNDCFINEFPHDISKMWIIVAMNDSSHLSRPLRDRLNIITIPAYDKKELHNIIKSHTFDESLYHIGFKTGDISITDNAIDALISRLNLETGGLRQIKAILNEVLSKIHMACHVDPKTLSYSVPGFTELPYIISTQTINNLCPAPKSKPYNPMYT